MHVVIQLQTIARKQSPCKIVFKSDNVVEIIFSVAVYMFLKA